MATETALPSILSSVETATESAIQSLPELATLLPAKDGLSLLDAKNDIFLSYLQALALRNLDVVRSLKGGASVDDVKDISDRLTAKMVEHRVYLERGVRPLEQKLKYQVDKSVQLANDEEKFELQRGKDRQSKNGNADSSSESDPSDEDDKRESGSRTLDSNSHRANIAGFGLKQNSTAAKIQPSTSTPDGVYRPPRISATSMPTTEQRDAKPHKPERSRTLDDYVRTELSSVPLAEPSIGSTIAEGGRTTKNARQLAREQERRDYEETHLMRLPPESKKERAKQKARERKGGFGGEEWQGIGESVDKINDLTRRRKESILERSRKRRAVEDGPRNDGTGVGSAFEAKKRRVMKKMKR